MKLLCLASVLLPVAVTGARHKVPITPHHQLSLRGAGSGTSGDQSKDTVAGRAAGLGEDSRRGQSVAQAAIGALVADWLKGDGKGPQMRDIIKTGQKKMDLSEAMRHVSQELPAAATALSHLMQPAGPGRLAVQMTEAEVQQSRIALNGMIERSYAELDKAVFASKEFSERNRETFDQVTTDLSRLGSSLAQLSSVRVGAVAGMTRYDGERRLVEERLQRETMNFNQTMEQRDAMVRQRREHLDALDFILNVSSCGSGWSTFIQKPGPAKPRFSICTSDRGLQVNISNDHLQQQAERLMTPGVKETLQKALVGSDSSTVSGSTAITDLRDGTSSFAQQLPPGSEVPMPVQEGPTRGQWKRCWTVEQDCGPLRYLMMLQWAELRDSIDEIGHSVATDMATFQDLTLSLNRRMAAITATKAKFMEELAAAVSEINANTDEMNMKEQEKRDLSAEYDRTTKRFRDQITDLLFTKICAYKKVRNHVVMHSTQTPPRNITDCDVSDWETLSGVCKRGGVASLCDDSCPHPTCGGFMDMLRYIVVEPNAVGVQCPSLSYQRRCGQKRCPQHCQLSAWTAWSRCSTECEGGVQAKTRTVLVKPRDGGFACDSLEEQQSCHTASCDADCSLQDWSAWGPCSAKCGGGVSRRTRAVSRPIQGNGRCPAYRASERLQERQCEVDACVGDEICVAQQDLILLLDASRSITERGFNILRNFTSQLTQRYRSRFFGRDAVRIGIVLFGNGDLIGRPNGTASVSSAIEVQELTDDMSLVESRIQGLQFQGGFKNLAQGLQLAAGLLTTGGRAGVRSAVIIFSDGEHSFKFQTAQKIQALKDRNVQVYVAPVSARRSDSVEEMKQWVSQPWSSNYELIPGFPTLEHNIPMFADNILVKFCPESMSPLKLQQDENTTQYMLVHKAGAPNTLCGQPQPQGMVSTRDECATMARASGHAAFLFGRAQVRGACFVGPFRVTTAYWQQYRVDREDPPCPGGDWVENPFYDTYIINPSLL